MNEHEYALMRQVEDAHWWYGTLRETAAGALERQLEQTTDARVLDAGCGTGGMLEVLRRRHPSWRLHGLDFSGEALDHCRRRGFVDLTKGSVNALPFADASFDAVLSLDVLYFEGVDDSRAMKEIHRILKPGGCLILNLPAFDVLRGQHDVAVRGVRRYTPRLVRDLIARSRLDAVRVHGWNLWLFFPILCWRKLSRMRQPAEPAEARSDLFMPPAPVNAMLTVLARLDMSLCRAIRSPLGTSVFAVATKNHDVEPNSQNH
jgi:SAM-dependent methyltransferase